MDEIPEIYWCGVVTGLILAVLLGTFFTRILEFRRGLRRSYSPMNTFPDSIQQSLTPARVVWSSCWAGIYLVFIIVIVIALCYGVIYYRDYLNDVIQLFFPS